MTPHALYFSAGAPRSGSTLLSALLAQNPANHVSPTNDLITLLLRASHDWTACEGFRAQGIEAVAPRIRAMLASMFIGFYPELHAGRAVFDKSRGWLAQIPFLEDILERRVQLLVTIRDAGDVCASFERIFAENQLTRPARSVEQRVAGATVLGRCQQYLAADATLGMWCNWLKDAFETGLSDRLILIPYAQLTANPIGVISLIHQSLGLPDFVCDPTAITNMTPEDDIQTYGLPYHTLRPSVDSSAVGRGSSLPSDVREWIDSQFSTINALAAGPVSVFGTQFSDITNGE